MAASANLSYSRRPRATTDQNSYRVKDAEQIYHNALVGIEAATGHAIGYDGAATTVFKGLANHERLGDSSIDDGDPYGRVIVDESGPQILAAVTGASADTANGDKVWATDDNTFTLSDPGGGVLPVARVIEWISGTNCWIQLLSAPEWAAQ